MSDPGNISIILPNGQFACDKFLSAITTKSPTWKFWVFIFHFFFLCARRGRYSAIYRFQNTDNMSCINFHFVRKLLILSCDIGMLTFGLLLPNRKWLGVKASISFMSSLIGIRGLPLMRDSISILNNSFQRFLCDLNNSFHSPVHAWGSRQIKVALNSFCCKFFLNFVLV